METMKQARSLAELKKAYRRLAFENHPDRGGSEERMKEINSVFQVCFDKFKTRVVTAADREDYADARTAREYTEHVYNEYRWKGSRYDGNLSLSDICKKIREYVAETFPTCKFSVTKDGYRSIYIALMKGDFEAYASEEQREWGSRGYNHHHPDSNKEFTERCNEVLDLVSRYANSYNYDNSDIMTDYFDVNFYLSVSVGKWNNAYVNTSVVINGGRLVKTETEKRVQKLLGAGNWVYMVNYRKQDVYCICKRGDTPYANWYSQFSVVKRKLEELRKGGIECEWFGSAIKINNWEEIESRIAEEREEMAKAAESRKVSDEKKEDAKPSADKVVVETVGGVRIIDYSDKAIAVVGDTRPIKDELRSAGGKFNAKLSCGCGWIFSKKKKDEVVAILKARG